MESEHESSGAVKEEMEARSYFHCIPIALNEGNYEKKKRERGENPNDYVNKDSGEGIKGRS